MNNHTDIEMRVTKRNGVLEPVSFDKILNRIKTAGNGIKVNFTTLAMKVIDQLYDTISATKIDELSAEQCASMTSIHPDYNILAGRIIISNHHKNTESSFTNVMYDLYQYRDKHGLHSPLISEELYGLSKQYETEFNDMCNYDRDYLIDFFGFKTLERAYLMQVDKKVIERPQHMWLRVSIGIHGSIQDPDLRMAKIRETYEYMSCKYFTHATPTLFNAGTPKPQLSSCYLISMESDSIDGIYNTLKDCALISKHAGGVGLHIHNVRATGSHIRGTNGTSNGIVPMLRVFNNTAKYVDQCVTADSMIFTTDGPIEISSCIPNVTKVFGRTGEIETVGNIMEYPYDGDINVIRSVIPDSPVLKITDEHPVYVLPNSRDKLEIEIVNDLKRGLLKPMWLEAKNVTEQDMLIYSIPKYERDNPSYTEEVCFIYGTLISNVITFQDGIFRVEFHAEYEMDRVMEYLNKMCIQYTHIRDKSVDRYHIEWTTNVALPFTRNDFFDFEGKKRVSKGWLFLPVEKTVMLMEGIYTGCSDKDLDFCYIETMWWWLVCESIAIEGDNKSVNGTFIKHDGLIYVPVKSVAKEPYKGAVYDLQLKEEHNYMMSTGLIHNGGGKRNGSFAIYLEPWHADIRVFLQMRKNHGDEEMKARDLFYALWMPDLFMERVKSDEMWTLMCPDECPGLADVYGNEFKVLYEEYERTGKGRESVKARDIWFEVLDAQMETGTPYLLYKDACNRKSNQKNLGTIKSSNLCVAPETIILTDKGHIEIQSLLDKTVNVWNGEEFSQVIVKKTGENQPLIDVYTDDGLKLACTPYHKFYIQPEDCFSCLPQQPIQVDAKDLKPGDKIIQCEYPIIDGTSPFLECDDSDDSSIPSGDCSIQIKIGWFSEICKKIGALNMNQLHINQPTDEYLIRIKYMLQTCGINPRIYTLSDRMKGDISLLPLYKLCISSGEISKLVDLGFEIAGIDGYEENGGYYVSILKIEDKGRTADTYCFTEPERHMGIFNGILTGQCTEIIEYSAPDETAVCNLASIALPAFITPQNTFDYDKLHQVAKVVTYNLNRIIDVNFYPTEKTRNSNMRHRPIGIGVQGLADVFMIMGHAFISDKAKEMNRHIFETIYHGALESSMEIAREEGPYSTFAGSPASEGILQFDLWDITPGSGDNRYDWPALKNKIRKSGLRNSLLLAPMPTASTSQILGYNECIEPITSNIYSRRTIAGEFVMANKYLMKDLMAIDLWNESTKNSIIANHGSIQHIESIPASIREKYKTVWELPMRHLIDMAADRGAYICQSQSLNLWLEDPNYGTLTSMHFYSWSKGLKTGIYYLRRRAKHQAQQFTIEPEKCEMCSS